MKNIYIFFALLGIAAFSACTNPFTGGNGGEGTIRLDITPPSQNTPQTLEADSIGFAPLSAINPGEWEDIIHKITLSGPGETIVYHLTGARTVNFTVRHGNWDVTILALGPRPAGALAAPGFPDAFPDEFPGMIVRAVGHTNGPVQVRAGQIASRGISMTMAIGVATIQQLNLALTWANGGTGRTVRLIRNIDDASGWTTPINLTNATFDGGGHTIRGLETNLFGTINGGTVRNLRLVDVEIDIDAPVGALAMANAIGSTVENVSVSGLVRGGAEVGGIVGRNNGTVRNVSVSGTVIGATNTVGGVVGQNLLGAYVLNSTVRAVVSGSGDSVGGVAGINNGTVEASFATGPVNSGNNNVGGVAGMNNGIVQNSFAIGNIEGRDATGGVVGSNQGRVENVFATGNVIGYNNVGGIVGENSASGIAIENSVALNPSVTAIQAGGNVGRIAGLAPAGLSNNHARNTMTLRRGGTTYTITPIGPNTIHGANAGQFNTQTFWVGLGWNFADIWRWDAGAWQPRLR